METVDCSPAPSGDSTSFSSHCIRTSSSYIQTQTGQVSFTLYTNLLTNTHTYPCNKHLIYSISETDINAEPDNTILKNIVSIFVSSVLKEPFSELTVQGIDGFG